MSIVNCTKQLHKSRTILGTAIIATLTVIMGCSNSDNTNTSSKNIENDATNVVTVYSSRNEQLIKPLLDEFTKETGINVELVTDSAGPLLARIKAESSNTPADMLLTVDAGYLWQAGKEDLLQPLNSEIVNKNVPEKYRSLEDYWTGLSLRARTIFYDPKKIDPSQLSNYADLADPKWKGKLCLRTSKKVYNQSLVASMIEHFGEERTQKIVEGWVNNLAAPVFSNDIKMLEAIAAGQCEVGIANSYYYGRLVTDNPDFPVSIFWAGQGDALEDTGTHVNVSGAGIVKYADNPEGARKLIEWLSSDEAQEVYARVDKEFPVKEDVDESDLLRSWGAFDQDDINVSIFGQRQAQAIQLMDRAGYD